MFYTSSEGFAKSKTYMIVSFMQVLAQIVNNNRSFARIVRDLF